MREIKAKRILTKNNFIDIYHGCSHNCLYCPGRSRLAGVKDFTNVGVKTNALEILNNDLWRKRRHCIVNISGSSDPYQPIEKELNIIRDILELFSKRQFGVNIRTKSDLILRDLDILKQINKDTKAVAEIELPTIDDKISKIMEPLVPSATERLNLIGKLKENNIKVVLRIKPILPFINNDPKKIDNLLKKAIELKVDGVNIFPLGIKMKNTSKEYFFKELGKKLPEIKKLYKNFYGEVLNYQLPESEKLVQSILSRLEGTKIAYLPKDLYQVQRKYTNVHYGKQLCFFN